jgi:hypothetical protein
MKSEVKTKFPNSEGQNIFVLISQDERRRFVRRASVLRRMGVACGQLFPRIHSTVRIGERSQAHMGDWTTWGSSKVIGELSGQRTIQLRGLALPRLQADRLGLYWPPGSAAAALAFGPTAPAPL